MWKFMENHFSHFITDDHHECFKFKENITLVLLSFKRETCDDMHNRYLYKDEWKISAKLHKIEEREFFKAIHEIENCIIDFQPWSKRISPSNFMEKLSSFFGSSFYDHPRFNVPYHISMSPFFLALRHNDENFPFFISLHLPNGRLM